MEYKAADVSVTCPICKHTDFDMDYRQLNTRSATFFNLDWANREVPILICRRCSFLLWFMHEPEAK